MIQKKWLTGIIIMSLASCQTFQNDDAGKAVSEEMLSETFSNSDQVPEAESPSQDILDSLIPAIELNQEQTLVSPRFDVKADKLPLNQFLMGLVDNTPFNMLVDPDLVQPITLQLNNVTIEEVLNVLQQTQNVAIQKQGSIYYVSGGDIQTAVYPLNYLNLKRTGNSQTRVSSGQIAQNGQQSGNDSNNNGGSSSSNNNSGNSGGGGEFMTLNSSKIETETEADVWKEVEEALNAFIENEENAFVKVSPQTGVVVVRAKPLIQRQVAEFLGVAQANLSRQVILEAKILEVRLSDGFQAGIDWAKVHTGSSGNTLALGQLGQVLDVAGESSPINGVFNLLYQSDPSSTDPFGATIQLLEEQGNVQVLSSPRVSTINNQKAVIKVGTDEFFVTNISTTTTGGLNSTTTPALTLTPFFSGIALDVTPQISAEGNIVLHIHPSVSEVKDQTKVVTVGTQEFSMPLALSSVRESDSIVRAQSGQVVVIGGLMQNKISDTESGTPVLSSVPILGNLFKQTRKKNVKSELVILLKATMIQGDNWLPHTQELKNKFNRLN